MQSNFNRAYRYEPFKAFETIPAYPKAIGEGDVTSIIFPDGSIQFYFIPSSVRHDRLSPCQHNLTNPIGHFHEPNNECWFVRSISYPQPTVFNNQLPTLYGDSLVSSLLNSSYCDPFYGEHLQKFHNDTSTSTTDIFYFYPCLRQDKAVKFNEIVQTEKSFDNSPNNEMHSQQPYHSKCSCKTLANETNCRCVCHCGSDSSVSCMSVDGDSKQKLKIKNTCKCSKHRKKNKKKAKERNLQCQCTKNTSDKGVTTFVDQASGTIAKDECDTRTVRQKSKKREVKMKRWTPLNINSSKYSILTSCSDCDNNRSSTCSCTNPFESDD